eukprot:1241587-Pyramimonas_sp.AAC.2
MFQGYDTCKVNPRACEVTVRNGRGLHRCSGYRPSLRLATAAVAVDATERCYPACVDAGYRFHGAEIESGKAALLRMARQEWGMHHS